MGETNAEPYVNWPDLCKRQVAALRRENVSFKSRVAALLREIQWSAWDGCGAEDHCPKCDAWQSDDAHFPDCSLAALLAECEK